MDEQLKTTSTSPDSDFSEFSLPDSGINAGIVPTMSAMSLVSSLRSSATIANMSSIASSADDQAFFRDEYSTRRSAGPYWWQPDTENLNQQFNSSNPQSSPPPSYLITDFSTNRNITSSSITDVVISPMARLSTSSSAMSLSSIGNQKLTSQRSFRPLTTNSTDQSTMSNDSSYHSPTTQYLPPPSASLSSRQTLSSVDNLLSMIFDNDQQRVPPSFRNIPPTSTYGTAPLPRAHPPHPQPQVVHTAGRANSMPSWRGYLPIRFEPINIDIDHYQIATHFSQKVFLGGIPAELTEAELLLVLRKFGKCNIKWPKSDGSTHNMPGFCHVVFRESRSVCELLKHCTRQQRSTIDYFLHIHMSPASSSTSTGVSVRSNRLKPIQVVPWSVRDNVYVMQQENISTTDASYKDWSRTIFVSPLHGKMTAFSLATIMSNVFGSVSMAQINTDKYGYPTGTGTVLFCDSHSYMRAVAAGAIDIKCDCFHKLLDIDPFLRENEPCAFCSSVADLFCRNFHCLRSYCKQCWVNRHGPKPLADHQPATRRQQPLPHV